MAYVVSATWTAQPGQEDIVRDAIDKLTPPSREEPGNVFYQAYQDPAEPLVFRLFEIYEDEDGVRRRTAPRTHFARVRARAGHPGAGQPRAGVLRDDRLTHVRLAVFRRHTDEPHARFVGLVLGHGEHLRVHPFDAGADLVELLAAVARVAGVACRRGRRGGRAAAGRGACCCRRSTRSRCATSSPSRRTSTAWSAGTATPARRRSGTTPPSSSSWRRTR